MDHQGELVWNEEMTSELKEERSGNGSFISNLVLKDSSFRLLHSDSFSCHHKFDFGERHMSLWNIWNSLQHKELWTKKRVDNVSRQGSGKVFCQRNHVKFARSTAFNVMYFGRGYGRNSNPRLLTETKLARGLRKRALLLIQKKITYNNQGSGPSMVPIHYTSHCFGIVRCIWRNNLPLSILSKVKGKFLSFSRILTKNMAFE